jgi:hypothetical protein
MEFLVDGFGTEVFDIAVQGMAGVEEAVDEGNDGPVGEVEEFFEDAVKDMGCRTL